MGWRGVKAPPRRGSQAGPAGGWQVSSVSEQGGGRQVPQRALRRELGTRVTKGMLSKTPGSGLVQEIQGLPQQLGTPAPNGPKIPSADKGILSAPGSSGAGRRLETGGGKPASFCSDWPGSFWGTFPRCLEESWGASLAGPACQAASNSSPRSLPFSRPRHQLQLGHSAPVPRTVVRSGH